MQPPHYKGSENPSHSELIQVKEKNNSIIIKPQALDIIWGNDPRYWRLYNSGPVELVQVCWLEVNGSISLNYFSRNIDYTVQFKLTLKQDAFGWNEGPIYLMVKVGKNGKPTWRSAYLSQNSYGETFLVPTGRNALRFRINKENRNENLIFGLYEVWRGRWKGGLLIEEVLISRCQ